jgi:hypothetical protein
VFEVSIQSPTLPDPPPTLAAAPQVFGQSVSHEVVDGAKGWTGVTQLEVVGPAAQVPVELLDEVRQWV